MIKVRNINGSPEFDAKEIFEKIKADNNGKAFGCHSDEHHFYFWESAEELESHQNKIKSESKLVNANTSAALGPILDLTLRSTTPSTASSYMPMFYFSKSSNVDYFLYRLLFLTENYNLFHDKLIKTAGDCMEKLLKCYLFSFNPSMNPKKDFSHGLNKIRIECAKIDSYFNKKELEVFCDQYSQKMEGYNGHQIFGYSDGTVVEGWQADFQQILDLLDEVFLETIIRMKNNTGLFHYDIFAIYLGHKTAKWKYITQPEKFEEVKKTYFTNNKFIDPFYKTHEGILNKIKDIPD